MTDLDSACLIYPRLVVLSLVAKPLLTSVGSRFPVRNATNDVTQNQELHVLLFQGLLSHNCPPRAGQYAIKSAEAK